MSKPHPLLTGLQAWLDAHPAPSQPNVAPRIEAPAPQAAPPTPQPAPAAWPAARNAYHAHHFACRQCCAAGQNPELSRCPAGAKLWAAYQATPAPDRREAVRRHRLAALDAERAMRELLDAAMSVCRYWGDGPDGKEQMQRGCMQVPPEDRTELRDRFLKQYGPQEGER